MWKRRVEFLRFGFTLWHKKKPQIKPSFTQDKRSSIRPEPNIIVSLRKSERERETSFAGGCKSSEGYRQSLMFCRWIILQKYLSYHTTNLPASHTHIYRQSEREIKRERERGKVNQAGSCTLWSLSFLPLICNIIYVSHVFTHSLTAHPFFTAASLASSLSLSLFLPSSFLTTFQVFHSASLPRSHRFN